MANKYRPIEFNAQAVSAEIMSYRDLRPEFYNNHDSAYCLDAAHIVPTGRVQVSAPGRLPTIEYVYRDKE